MFIKVSCLTHLTSFVVYPLGSFLETAHDGVMKFAVEEHDDVDVPEFQVSQLTVRKSLSWPPCSQHGHPVNYSLTPLLSLLKFLRLLPSCVHTQILTHTHRKQVTTATGVSKYNMGELGLSTNLVLVISTNTHKLLVNSVRK